MSDEQPAEAPVAPSEAATFHFQKFTIKLPGCKPADLLHDKPEGRTVIKDTPSHHYGLFAHEFSHYLQAIGTVVGQRIMLNWFATVVGVTQDLEKAPAIKVPFAKSAMTSPYEDNALKTWNSYIFEANALVGCQLPLRPHGEADAVDLYDFYEYKFPHPADGKETTGIAVVLPTEDGGRIGVPLQGDVFFEGWSQAVQWQVDGEVKTFDERLADRPVDARQTKHKVYYTTIARVVRHRLPGFDPLQTTVALCDAALCTRTPGQAFVKSVLLLERHSERLLASGDPPRAARMALQECDEWVEGRRFILEQLQARVADFEKATGDTASNFMRIMTDLMVRSWNARNSDSAWMLDAAYRDAWIERMVMAVGGPPLFLEDRDDAFPLAADQWIIKAAFWSRGSYDLLEEMICHSFTRECPFLRTKICDSKVVKKTAACREGDVLNAPICDGLTCHVGVAGKGMNLHGRKWRRI